MKLLIYIACSILIISCSSTQYTDSDIDKISIDMGVLNQRLVGYLNRKKMNKDLSKLDLGIYLESVKEIKDPSEVEYTTLLFKKGVEFNLRGSKKDFIICVKDLKPKLILCDLGSTPFVEKIVKGKNEDLEKLIYEVGFIE